MATIIAKVYKYPVAAGKVREWVNTYHFRGSGVEVGSEAANNIVEALVTMERAVHTEAVRFDRVTVSTVEKDGANPVNVQVTPIGALGNVQIDEAAGSVIMPANVAVHVSLNRGLGRNGANYYRLALSNADAEAVQGVPVLATAAKTRIDAALTAFIAAVETAGGEWIIYSSKYEAANLPILQAVAIGLVEKGTTANRKSKGSESGNENNLVDIATEVAETIAKLVVVMTVAKVTGKVPALPAKAIAALAAAKTSLDAAEKIYPALPPGA